MPHILHRVVIFQYQVGIIQVQCIICLVFIGLVSIEEIIAIICNGLQMISIQQCALSYRQMC